MLGLLKTKRNIGEAIESLGSGQFFYSGILKGLICLLEHVNSQGKYIPSTLNLTFSVDGLPISKSGSVSFWPILSAIDDLSDAVFIVAIYCGTGKPDINSYLENFTFELKDLLQNGFLFSGKPYTVKVEKFVCDAPARAFMKQIKGHGGYYSCERCCVKGTYNNGMSYNSLDAPIRTDETFANKEQPEHHTGTSPLVEINISMVSSFVLDYMHLVLLGI
jgi:hypothetical protein